MHIMAWLVALSLTLSMIVLLYLLAHHESLKESLSFTVVLIVASIPVAIEIVSRPVHPLAHARGMLRDHCPHPTHRKPCIS